jgi:hypothetical protein
VGVLGGGQGRAEGGDPLVDLGGAPGGELAAGRGEVDEDGAAVMG